MERVAERAGTSRAVIYRRWRSRPELVIAAMRHRQPVLSGQVPDTGTLRGEHACCAAPRIRADHRDGPDTVIGMLKATCRGRGGVRADPRQDSYAAAAR